MKVTDQEELMSTYEEYSASELIERIQSLVVNLPECERDGARFELVKENYPYDTQDYFRVVMKYQREETLEERQKREREEQHMSEIKEQRERQEFQRLSKKYGI